MYVNKTLSEYFGTESADFTSIPESLRALRGESVSYELEWKGRSFRNRVQPLLDAGREIVGSIGVAMDVTELRKSEEARSRLAAIVESSDDAIVGLKLDGVISSWNMGAERTYGYSADEACGRHISILAPPGDRAEELRDAIARLERTESAAPIEIVRMRKDGRRIDVSLASSLIRGADGAIVGVAEIGRDVSERKRAEAALRISEERFRSVFEASPLGMSIVDVERRFLQVNASFCRILGYRQEEVIGRSFVEITHPEDIERDVELASRALAGEIPSYRIEKRFVGKDGEVTLADLTATIVRDAEGRPLCGVGMFFDITEHRRVELEVRNQQGLLAHALRVSTLGEMTANLAHELNQPLAAIVSYARGCVRRLNSGGADPDDLRFAVEQLADQALRAGEVFRRFRGFLRKDSNEHVPVRVATLVAEVIRLIQMAAPEDAKLIEADVDGELPQVEADAIQIQQVLVNPVRNALEALNGGERRVRIRARTAAGMVEVSVEDTGRGVPEALRDRIFETFVTTKPDGLGMGLSISRPIVQAHGGRLWVGARASRGTVFRFTLPIALQADGR